MKRAKLILVAALTILLAGCVLRGKPKVAPAPPAPPPPVAPAPPPEPLSILQTRVNLPAPQPPVSDAALKTAQPEELPAALPAQTKPAQTKPANNHPPTPPKPVEPTAIAPAENTRPPIQEVLPQEEQKRLLNSAQKHRTDVAAILAQRHQWKPNETSMKLNIEGFVKQSQQAEESGDMRSADEFAEKAYILAKELQGGK